MDILTKRHNHAVEIIMSLYESSYSIRQISTMFGFSVPTVYKWVKTNKISKSSVEWILSIHQGDEFYKREKGNVYIKKNSTKEN